MMIFIKKVFYLLTDWGWVGGGIGVGMTEYLSTFPISSVKNVFQIILYLKPLGFVTRVFFSFHYRLQKLSATS